jgi:Protein of unknown function (DUF2380)
MTKDGGRVSAHRDAQNGAVIFNKQTDLRMGANYSWSRGATWLIKNRLLNGQDQP